MGAQAHRPQGNSLKRVPPQGVKIYLPYGLTQALGLVAKGSGSIGRASVSKTEGWGFESLLPCSKISSIAVTS